MGGQRTGTLNAAYDYLKRLLQDFDGVIVNIAQDGEKCGKALTEGLNGISWLEKYFTENEHILGYTPDCGLGRETAQVADYYKKGEYGRAGGILEDAIMPVLAEWLDVLEEAVETAAGEVQDEV